ncbi:hypothetical protein [Gordonia polyisoprenivorans]|uniref:hypothetical protein n=1 Tax=Gordonia polyisoprenivorans TaxID=84595 RepID=UPI001AD7D5C5|nr:hypothetical protein [Gordonia polyisoprenivorans]QTI67476.1 hypothetical protein J6U32_17980 [Gordonia polyisoprenivorans]
MKRALLTTVGVGLLVLASAGCSDDQQPSAGSSSVAAAPSVGSAEWPIALDLIADLTGKGFVCTDEQVMPAQTEFIESAAKCKTGPENGGGIYVYAFTFGEPAQAQSALQTKTAGNSIRRGPTKSAYVSDANWIVECPDGDSGGPGDIACKAAQETIGGTLTQ